MAKALRIINGVPRTVDVTMSVEYYDETYLVPDGGLAANALITLPSLGTYKSTDLKVFRNGVLWEVEQQFDYVGESEDKDQIEILYPLDAGERIRFVVSGDAALIYDEVIVVPTEGYDGGTNLTLPNLQTYNDVELQVYLSGQRLEANIDYNYVGNIPRTQIQTVIDLFAGERLRYRIESA